MALRDFFFKKQEPKQEMVSQSTPLYSTFSSPFTKIGDGNLALPYVRGYINNERYVRFGVDNLFPQLINQMYYASPLNGSIINFKTNSVIGGGFESNGSRTGKDKVAEYTFMEKNKIVKMSRQLTKDLIMHGRVYVMICNNNGKISMKRIGPEKVRVNIDKCEYTISDDWTRNINIRIYKAFNPTIIGDSIYCYEIDGDAGQDIYPLPGYISALNWCFVDGEMSYLQKSNIVNSIFPSFMITMAKKFESQVEADQFKETINKSKGAPEAGRIMTFVSEFAENLPTVTPIPQNNNDKVFIETVTNLEANICRGHQIDPLIMGIRPSGKLGSGAELPVAYSIYEKNVVLPLREMMEEILDDLFFIGGITTSITINNYQIVDEQIVNATNTKA